MFYEQLNKQIRSYNKNESLCAVYAIISNAMSRYGRYIHTGEQQTVN